MMERWTIEGVLPLVFLRANGPAYRCEALAESFREQQVIHLFSLPHTPQHNAGLERANREVKETADLRDGMTIEEVRAEIETTRLRLNRRPRPSRNGLTADELNSILAPATSIVSREAFYSTCQRAIDEAVAGVTSGRARRIATRNAIFTTKESLKLITVTRGGAPNPFPQE